MPRGPPTAGIGRIPNRPAVSAGKFYTTVSEQAQRLVYLLHRSTRITSHVLPCPKIYEIWKLKSYFRSFTVLSNDEPRSSRAVIRCALSVDPTTPRAYPRSEYIVVVCRLLT